MSRETGYSAAGMAAERSMRWLKKTGYAALAVLAIAAIAVAAALIAYRDIPTDRLESKYTSPASRFIHIDGVRIHYRDEGAGPAVLLLHGNFSNLLGWDPWVAALKDKYRVVRFDITAFGLTGADPSGNYSDERTLALTEKLVDAVGLKRFAIGGTSLGGNIAIRYAVKHPGRIDKLILLNPAMLTSRALDRSGERIPDAAEVLRYITPRSLASYLLRSRAGDPAKITEEHVDRWYDMWMREGNRAAMLRRLRVYRGSDPANLLGQVKVPVLIMWGAANPEAPVAQAEELKRMLANAPDVRLITYPGVGRPALEEAGDITARDARAWLDGTLDPKR